MRDYTPPFMKGLVMARKRYGKRERQDLKRLKANGAVLMPDGAIVARRKDELGMAHNVLSCIHPSRLTLPVGKPSRLWEWDWKTNARIRREQRVSKRVAK